MSLVVGSLIVQIAKPRWSLLSPFKRKNWMCNLSHVYSVDASTLLSSWFRSESAGYKRHILTMHAISHHACLSSRDHKYISHPHSSELLCSQDGTRRDKLIRLYMITLAPSFMFLCCQSYQTTPLFMKHASPPLFDWFPEQLQS